MLHDLATAVADNPRDHLPALVLADWLEERGHVNLPAMLRNRKPLGQRPSYAPRSEDDYEVSELIHGPHSRGFGVFDSTSGDLLSEHGTERSAERAVADLIADIPDHQSYVDHIRTHGKEIAPGLHLVPDGKQLHLHDLRKMPKEGEYDPEILDPVVSFGNPGRKMLDLARRLILPEQKNPKRAKITGLTEGGDCEHCGKKDVALIHVTDDATGKTKKLGSTCVGKMCRTLHGDTLHRAAAVKHGHSMNMLHKEGREPVYPTIYYDGDQLQLARSLPELAHAFHPDKSPKAFAEALAEIGHPLAPFVAKAKTGKPLIKTPIGHEWSGEPGSRGRREIHVPRVRTLESPDLGIHRVGFHYDPEAGEGHIVVTMKTEDPTGSRELHWHAPATKEELRGLGLRNRRMKLQRPFGAHEYEGYVSPDGKFHANEPIEEGDEYGMMIGGHEPTAHRLGFESEEAAQAAGYMHVAYDREIGLHGHLPNYDYTAAQLRTLKQIADRSGFDAVNISTKVNGKPSTRRLKLARKDIHESLMPLYTAGVHGGDNGALLVLADALEERGHDLLATIFRRGARYREKYGTVKTDNQSHHNTMSLWGTQEPNDSSVVSAVPQNHRWNQHPWVSFYHPETGDVSLSIPMRKQEASDYFDKYATRASSTLSGAQVTKDMKEHRDPELTLARPDVISDSLSLQQKVRRKLAAKIALEAGLKLQALVDARTQDHASVLQAYGHENEPDAIDYAAAWFGLLTKAPRLSAFHVHDGGPDTYHTWHTPLDPDSVLNTATGLGLNAVVTSNGSVAVLDRGNQAAEVINRLKESTNADRPISEPGTAKPFASRDDYRATIRAYEQSVFGDRPSAPAATGGQ